MILSSLHANYGSWSKDLIWNCTALTNKNTVVNFATPPATTLHFSSMVSFSFTGKSASPYHVLFWYGRFKEQNDDREYLVRVQRKNELGNLSSTFQSKGRVLKNKQNKTKQPVFFLIRKESMSSVPKKGCFFPWRIFPPGMWKLYRSVS